jgi:hypothetical protein
VPKKLRARELRELVRRQQLLLSEQFAPECSRGHGQRCLTAGCLVCKCKCGGYNHGRMVRRLHEGEVVQ